MSNKLQWYKAFNEGFKKQEYEYVHRILINQWFSLCCSQRLD